MSKFKARYYNAKVRKLSVPSEPSRLKTTTVPGVCTGQSQILASSQSSTVGLALAAQRRVVTVDQREAMIRELPMDALGVNPRDAPHASPTSNPFQVLPNTLPVQWRVRKG